MRYSTKGTIIDATIIESGNRPLSKKKRYSLETSPSSQIDTDIESKIIRKRAFSSAKPHDSRFTDELLRGDEKAIFGDNAYLNKKEKHMAASRRYEILDLRCETKKIQYFFFKKTRI